jgi:uncharacterized SAM-dependent methyltransferase
MTSLCKFVVPAINQSDLFSELKQQIRINEIPHKFFYWDFHCSNLWKKLAESKNFISHNQFVRHLNDNYSEIHQSILKETGGQIYDLISLGVGIGEDDEVILKQIIRSLDNSGSTDKVTYFLVDISLHLIKYSLNQIEERLENLYSYVEPAIFNVDMSELTKYKDNINELSRNPKLFCLLGSTMGNYTEFPLIAQFAKMMTDDDFFLLGVDCPMNKFNDEIIQKRYSEADEGYEFLLGPLKSLSIFPDTNDMCAKFSYSDPLDIPGSKHILHEIKTENSSVIKLNKSTKYNSTQLKEWLRDRFHFQTICEFEPSGINRIDGSNYMLFLFKKKVNLNDEEELSRQTTRDLISAILTKVRLIEKKVSDGDIDEKHNVFDSLERLKGKITQGGTGLSQDELFRIKDGLVKQLSGLPTSSDIEIIINANFN